MTFHVTNKRFVIVKKIVIDLITHVVALNNFVLFTSLLTTCYNARVFLDTGLLDIQSIRIIILVLNSSRFIFIE